MRRRHVIYVEGYDPRGAEAYYRLFQRECARFRRTWSAHLTLHRFEIDSEDFAHWLVDVQAPDGQAAVHYDFLRLERFIRSDMSAPLARRIMRGLRWIVGDFVSGAHFKIFRTSWRFGLHLACIQLLLLTWLVLPVVVAVMVCRALSNNFGLPLPIDVAAGLVVALVSLLALRPIANRWLVIQVANCWVTLRRFARGQATWIDQATDVGARRLIAAARASELDELVVVGHSTGGVIAMELMARALKLDPDLGRRGPRLVLLTLGSVMPAVALHPLAARMRDVVKRLAIEPTLTWVDCQSRKDVMNFAHFDPVAGVGLHVGEQRRNPRVRLVRFRDMVSPRYYRRLRWQFFRMHFQYIMASDRQSPYDYILLVAGPGAIGEWASRDEKPSLTRVRSGMSGGEDARPRADDIAGATSRP